MTQGGQTEPAMEYEELAYLIAGCFSPLRASHNLDGATTDECEGDEMRALRIVRAEVERRATEHDEELQALERDYDAGMPENERDDLLQEIAERSAIWSVWLDMVDYLDDRMAEDTL